MQRSIVPQVPQISLVWPPISSSDGVTVETWLSLWNAELAWRTRVGVLKLFLPDDTPLNGPIPDKTP